MHGLRVLSLFLGLLLVTPVVSAQVERWQSVKFSNLNGGLNNAGDPSQLELNEASNLQNITLNPLGGISRRDGFAEINSTAVGTTFTGLAFYRQADGDRFLVGINSHGTDTIRKMDYGSGTTGPDGTWDDITGALSPSVTNDDLADFAVAEDQIVIEDGIGTTAPFTWTGSGNAAALGGSPSNATMVEYHKRHLWTAGLSTARSRITFSNQDDITTWTGTDTIEVETDDGQIITAIRSALDCLYVFKTESIWRICGSTRDDFVLEQTVEGLGASNNQAVALINNQFVFMTSQGDVAVYDGGVKTEIISTKIEGTLTGLNLNRIDQTVSVAFDDQTGDQDFYLCVSDGGSATHDLLLVFDTFHRAWTKFSGINCNALATYEVGTQQRAIAFADYAGKVHRYPSGDTDNGATIDTFYTSGHYDFEVTTQKIFRLIQSIFQQRTSSHNVAVEYRIDFQTSGPSEGLDLSGSGATWGTAVYGTDTYGDLTTALFNTHVDRPGNFIQWHIAENSHAGAFTLRNLRIFYEDLGRVQ